MKSLQESLETWQYETRINEEYFAIVAEETINESFKSSLLSSLAKAIYDVEKKHRDRDKAENERHERAGMRFFGKSEKTFASIFGPITKTGRYGNVKDGIQGLKWSEIKDEDFDEYKSVDTKDKNFVKVMKSVYAKGTKYDVIICKPGTKEIMYFIKGYGETDSVNCYGFNNEGYDQGVKEKTAKHYSYQTRALKLNEVLPLIEGCDVYVLEITNDMIKQYETLHKDRKKSQEGIVNYDAESLKEYAKRQQARYKALAAEMKANKLQGDPKKFFDDLTETTTRLQNVFKKLLSKPENLDEYFDMGRVFSYMEGAYDSLYDSAKSSRKSDKRKERAKENGREYNREFDWDADTAKEKINDSKEYMDNVNKMLDEIESKLK